LQQRHVAVDANLQEQVGELRAAPDERVEDFLRVFETRHARFRQRVDVDDATAAPLRGLQRREHARVVRPRVLPDDVDRLGLAKSSSVTVPLADADCLRERRPARLVAHVRAVGQIVRAELADEELIEERRLVARAPRV
jgi:hypothetical protein